MINLCLDWGCTFAVVEHLLRDLLLNVLNIFLSISKYLWEDWGFDISHLWSAIFRTQQLIDSSETTAQSAIKVVLYGIVSPALADHVPAL